MPVLPSSLIATFQTFEALVAGMIGRVGMNWRGKPLISHEVIVSLIAATTTRTGLTVQGRT